MTEVMEIGAKELLYEVSVKVNKVEQVTVEGGRKCLPKERACPNLN
jgi:hypothetical protein